MPILRGVNMKIKEDKQLKKGDLIKWKLKPISTLSNPAKRENYGLDMRNVKLLVKEVYPHFVEFTVLEPPFLTISITNNELYQNGIYKNTDFVNPFARF